MNNHCSTCTKIAIQELRQKLGSRASSATKNSEIFDLTQKLADTLSREAQQRQLLKLRLAGRKKSTEAETEFAVPHLD